MGIVCWFVRRWLISWSVLGNRNYHRCESIRWADCSFYCRIWCEMVDRRFPRLRRLPSWWRVDASWCVLAWRRVDTSWRIYSLWSVLARRCIVPRRSFGPWWSVVASGWRGFSYWNDHRHNWRPLARWCIILK